MDSGRDVEKLLVYSPKWLWPPENPSDYPNQKLNWYDLYLKIFLLNKILGLVIEQSHFSQSLFHRLDRNLFLMFLKHWFNCYKSSAQ